MVKKVLGKLKDRCSSLREGEDWVGESEVWVIWLYVGVSERVSVGVVEEENVWCGK